MTLRHYFEFFLAIDRRVPPSDYPEDFAYDAWILRMYIDPATYEPHVSSLARNPKWRESGNLFAEPPRKEPWELPDGETYDPPLGRDLCARLNAPTIKQAAEELRRLRGELRNTPSSVARQKLLRSYERVIGDFEEWILQTYAEYPECLMTGEHIFKHSMDYAYVRYKDKSFNLTPRQRLIIQVLHENYLNGTPDMGNWGLVSQVNKISVERGHHGYKAATVQASFKKNLKAYKTLIVFDKHTKTYSINL